MNNGKVLFIDSAHISFSERLTDLGFECETINNLTYQQLLTKAEDYVGFVIRSRFAIDVPMINAAKQLKFIARIGAGMENIDVEYARKNNIACINSPEGNADAVSEFVIGALLTFFRNIIQANTQVRQGIWLREENRGIELNTKIIGIVGYGNMGKCLAKKMNALGCRVLAYDKYKTNFADQYAQEVTLETLQANADIVSVHINYTPENFYFINRDFISNFAKPIYLVNTSRGKVLNTNDIVNLLNERKIIGAILDVLEYEDIRLQNKPKEQWDNAMNNLANNENVLLSPHIAGQTRESLTKHVDVLINKLQQLSFMQ